MMLNMGKFGLYVIMLSIIIPISVSATDYYVDNSLSTCNTLYNPADRTCGSGSDTSYNTFAEASAASQPGDVIWIRSGTFNEKLRPQRSGAPGNYITFRSYEDEVVTITGLSTHAIDISDRDYIIVDGLVVTNVAYILRGHTSNHNIISNNVFTENTGGGTTGGFKIINAHYNKILNNTFFDINADSLTIVDSDYNLVEGNSMSKASHNVWNIYCGNYNILRNNYFENDEQKIGSILDCESAFSDAPYELDATKHNLVENNIFALTSSYYATSGGNGIQYAAQDGIVRRNIFYGNNVGLGIQHYSDEAQYIYNNRVYHNVFYDNLCAGISLRQEEEGDVYKNNILYWNKGWSGDCFGTSPAQIVYRGDLGGYLFERNNIFNQFPGEYVIHREFGSGNTLSHYEGHAQYNDNLESDPGFVSPDEPNRDFTLKEGSQMIDAGTFLTRTVGAGSGTTMQVEDADYFIGGYGIVEGDVIQLEGSTERRRIVDVDYSSDTLTLDDLLTWSDGQGVTLAYSGSALDIGAFEYQGGAGECTENSDCDDVNACTADICASGTCRNPNCDLDGNDNIGLGDIIQIIAYWAGSNPDVDLDENGNVGLSDIMLLLGIWGTYC